MSFRVHTASAADVAVSVCDDQKLTELYDIQDDDSHRVVQALVIEDGGNGEALVLTGTTEQLVTLANDILEACKEQAETDINNEAAFQEWRLFGDR